MIKAALWNREVTWDESGFHCPALAAVATLLNVTFNDSAAVEEWARRYFPSQQSKAAAVIEYYGGVITEQSEVPPEPATPDIVY